MTGPLTQYVEGLEAELLRAGYARGTVDAQLRMVAGLDGWLVAQNLDAAALTAAVIEQFMVPRRGGGEHLRTARALEPLIGYLRDLGVSPPPASAVAVTPLEQLLARYERYLLVERGLAASTVRRYVHVARAFLGSRESDAGVDLNALCARDVTEHVVAVCRVRRGRELVTALRSLLGFLHLDGLVGPELGAAVPSVAGWRLTGLPQALERGQVRLLLDSCDRDTIQGRRDFAILTLLVRLGLRRGEVAALLLDDIDWRAGEIAISNGKRGRRERLPLPDDVGEALVGYLRDGRPHCVDTRRVFIRMIAPSRALTSNGVGDVVRAAGRRAGLGEIAAHRLRHTAATDMLRADASLAEIGQVLRHRTPRTTAIYAKVDLEALRRLARPWPEDRS
ncbi:MAG: site-specific integrase [Solirubrobacteraceae bacterium]